MSALPFRLPHRPPHRSSGLVRLALTAAVSFMAGCTEPNPAFESPEAVCEAGTYFVGQEFEFVDPNKLDILFVVDNSPGMLENQRALASGVPGFVARLNSIAALDWRIGVVSSDLAQGAQLQTGPAGQGDCPNNLPVWVDRTTPNAPIAAGCNMVIGQSGSDFEQSLETARRAIAAEPAGNNGFMRADARLLIVFFTSEDDCTVASSQFDRADQRNCVWQKELLVPVEDYARYFDSAVRAYQGTPVSVVTIVGPRDNQQYTTGNDPRAVCTGAAPALSGDRLIALAQSPELADTSMVESICSTSFTDTLVRVFDEVVNADTETVCLALDPAGAPRAVLVGSGDDAEELTLGDYIDSGASSACATTEIALGRSVLRANGSQSVEVRYCTATNPNATN